MIVIVKYSVYQQIIQIVDVSVTYERFEKIKSDPEKCNNRRISAERRALHINKETLINSADEMKHEAHGTQQSGETFAKPLIF
jgi:hypothetical protein